MTLPRSSRALSRATKGFGAGPPDAIAHEKAKAVAAVPENGAAVLNADDPRVLEMARHCRGRVVTFGVAEDADVRISDLRGGYPAGRAALGF